MPVRKRKTTNGFCWTVDFKYNKKRYTKSGFKTKKEALNHEAIVKNELLTTGKMRIPTKKTLEDVVEEFFEVGSGNYQENTILNTKNNIKFVDELMEMSITEFDYVTLQTFFNSRENKAYESNNNIKKALSRVFEYAIKVGYIQSNPTKSITIKGIKRRNETHLLTIEQAKELIDYFYNSDKFYYKAIGIAIAIGFYTGLRISEALALDNEDIDFYDNTISINKKLIYRGLKKKDFYVSDILKTKTSKSVIPLNNVLKKLLLEWFEINPYDVVVCDEDGYYISPDSMSITIKKLAKKLGIEFNYHGLRHSFATILIENNVDVKTAQELLRHNNYNTTLSLYTHVKDEKKLETVNKIFS